MPTSDIVIIIIGLVFVIGVPTLLLLKKFTYIDPMKRSIERDLGKLEDLSNGALPLGYRNLKNNEERRQAVDDLSNRDLEEEF